MPYLTGLWWLLLMLGPLLFTQRWLHREIQLVFFIITRRATISLGLFSLLFFPGVFLHETSHYLMARLLGVRTGGFSLIPRLTQEGKLRLGYVETAATDIFRDALIGAAPLITGGMAVAYLGINQLGVMPLIASLTQGNWAALQQGVAGLPAQADFWLWFYLAFAISSTMLPSASDRRAWLQLLLFLLVVVAVALIAGAGPWLLAHVAPWLNQAFQSLAMVFGISLALELVILIPFRLLRAVLLRASGLRIVEPPG